MAVCKQKRFVSLEWVTLTTLTTWSGGFSVQWTFCFQGVILTTTWSRGFSGWDVWRSTNELGSRRNELRQRFTAPPQPHYSQHPSQPLAIDFSCFTENDIRMQRVSLSPFSYHTLFWSLSSLHLRLTESFIRFCCRELCEQRSPVEKHKAGPSEQ